MSRESMRKRARSGTMECPLCGTKRALVEHHIHGRDVPNASASWNRAYICPACHDDVHVGKVVIEGWVSTSEGKMLAWHYAGEEPEALEGASPKLYVAR